MIKEIYGILREICIAHSPMVDVKGESRLDVVRRINTFAVLDEYKQFNQTNLGKNKLDEIAGTYWVRSGVSWDNDKKEYGILAVEHKVSVAKNFKRDEICHEVYLNLAFPVECKDCPRNRTPEQIDCDNLETLRSIVKVLSTYRKYEGELNGEAMTIWATEEGVECLDDFVITRQCGRMDSIMQLDKVQYFQGGKFVQDLRIKSAKLTFCTCIAPNDEFNWKAQAKGGVGTVKCETC